IAGLCLRAWCDPPFGDDINAGRCDSAIFPASHQPEHIADVIDGDDTLLIKLRIELAQRLFGSRDRGLFASQANFAIAVGDGDAERLADGPQMLVACTE